MRLIESPLDVGEAIGQVKRGASAYTSNFFPAPRKLEGWVAHRQLFGERVGDAAFFWRPEADLWHLHFCAASPAALAAALAGCPGLRSEPVVVDLVGQARALDEVGRIFCEAGFRPHTRLFRMARVAPVASPPVVVPDSRVEPAVGGDVQPIHRWLYRSFDCRAEQIPPPYELEAAVSAGQIRVVRIDGRLAGLLFFETQGLTSTLRYWLVAPEHRAARVGSALMQWYLAAHPAVRRFLLWVVEGNANAIGKYEHYGYAPDGLVDHVLANEVIPA